MLPHSNSCARHVASACGILYTVAKVEGPLPHWANRNHSCARQGAYGILVEVESHPFPLDTMLFMDWRDDYTAPDPQMQAANRCAFVDILK